MKKTNIMKFLDQNKNMNITNMTKNPEPRKRKS